MRHETNGSSLLRLIGVMGIGVGAAWALQILGFATDGISPFDRLMWVLAAASVCGGSFGLIVVSGAIDEASDVSVDASRGLVRN